MAKPRNDLLDRLAYAGIRLVTMVLGCFPIESMQWAARGFGNLWYQLDRKHRRRALANLQSSFPQWTDSQREHIARRSFEHMFMLTVEVLFTPRLVRLETWRQYFQVKQIDQILGLLMKRDKGLIVLTGHYGNWEILGYLLATLGFHTTTVARRLDNPYLSEWVFGFRESKGQRIVDKKGATTEVAQLLANGGTVAFVADQNAGSKGLFVDFFGRKASTFKSIGLLAMTYEVPIMVGYARRLNDRFQFEAASADIIWPADWKDQADPLRYITQRYTRAIEDMVRIDPHQYLWAHRRWKSRPKGEAPMAYD